MRLKELAIILPSIRTHQLHDFYESVALSAGDLDWELIVASPFEIPKDLGSNVTFVQSYASVPVCIQKATLHVMSHLVMHAVDDAIYFKDAIKAAVSLYREKCSVLDVVGLTYVENTNHMTTADKWCVRNDPEFRDIEYINKDWQTFVQPLMATSLFARLGGFDCSFEYSNHPHHDFAFRVQQYGGKIYYPDFPVSYASHMPERTGDHGPIHDAQTTIDEKHFRELWSSPRDSVIDYLNFREYDVPWKRRFAEPYKSYDEMTRKESYKI